MSRQRIWDLPTRLFHWSLVGAIIVAVVTGKIGGNWIEWHGRSGLFILGLIIFRVIWGFIGSPTARFANFVRGPRAIKAYLKGEWQGVGHNPLGALAVLGLLGLTAIQVLSGLFANDDIAFAGPLASLVSSELSGRITGAHVWLFNSLLAVVCLHVAAIVFYARVKKTNLVLPMVTGYQALNEGTHVVPHHRHSFALRLAAFVAASAIASAGVYAAAGGFIDQPAPPPAEHQAAPAW
ncbi:cytochrome b/b6 domain-containing protein [Ferribacterium limneticum]|uniref:cytochrome b/b6 domain-containing protein n=1 Tax=Ferribacterium limneticum TaxID=76259 RepID=UPI001CF84088|nr:cytochrome b/b6 domain-containing protein [Ferribacterium limneticum]UCV21221.1 cytochrome b/b6 domain-containing protein [Ferribacterium limneticum]